MFRTILIILLLTVLNISAEILEDFNNNDTGMARIEMQTNAFGYIKLVPGYDGDALKISVGFSNINQWLQTYKNFKYLDLSEGDELRFYYQYQGDPVYFYLNLTDPVEPASEQPVKTLQTTSGWQILKINLNNFSQEDLSKITMMKFILKKDSLPSASGSMIVNKLDLYRTTPVVSETILIDDFSDADDLTTLIGSQGGWINPTDPGTKLLKTNETADYLTLTCEPGSIATEIKWLFKQTGTVYTNLKNYDYIKMRIKCNKPNIKIGITIQHSSSHYLINSTHHDFHNQWADLIVPIKNFDSENMGKIDEIQLLLGLKGTVDNTENFLLMVDDVMLYREPKNAGFVKTIDQLNFYNSSSPWNKYAEEDNILNVSTVNGFNNNKAIKLDYSLINGNAALIERYFYLDLSEGFLQFKFRSEGDFNHFEVKAQDIEDGDNVSVTYIRKFHKIVGNCDDWVTLKIFPEDWTYFGSSDSTKRKNLRLNKIEKLWFVLNQYETSRNATVYIDDIEYVDQQGHYYVKGGHQIIDYLKVDSVNFSPNDDGFNDSLKFHFKLKSSAKINIYMFNLEGELIKTFYPYGDGRTYDTKEHTLEWDGKNNDSDNLRNGIYIFKFIAFNETAEDNVKNVIAITK